MKLNKICLPHALLFCLPLVNCSLGVCSDGAPVADHPPSSQLVSTNGASEAQTVTGNAGSAASATQAAAERPPRPSERPGDAQASETRPALADEESWTDAYIAGGTTHTGASEAEASDETGLGSSTWPQTPHAPAVRRELSVEPGTLDLLPDDAPAWVGSPPDLSQDVHRLFVGGQIAESEVEAAEGLDASLVRAIRQYVEKHLLHQAGSSRGLSTKLTADYVWKNLIDHRSGYVAKLNTPGQPMYQKWVTVSITPEQRGEMQRWHREALQLQRLAPIGVGFTSLLACVGLLHLILRRKPGLNPPR